MPEFYGYVERKADSYVNWGKIGADMSKMIADENKAREDKKAELDEGIRKTLNDLADAPQGQNQNINEFTTTAASDATEYLLMQQKLLKSGQLKLRDFLANTQNTKDGMSNMFKLSTEYQKNYQDLMDGISNGKYSASNAQIMGMVESFGKFANTKSYINPLNGMVSVGKTKKQIINGKEVTVMDGDPDKFHTISDMKNFMNIRIPKYQMTDDLNSETAKIGQYVTSTYKPGTLTKFGTITETMNQANRTKLDENTKKQVNIFEKYVDGIVDAKLTNPMTELSVMTDWVGVNPKTNKAYSVTFDEKLAKSDPNYIYLKKGDNGYFTPELTPEQKAAAKDRMRNSIYNMLDQKTSIKETGQPSPLPQPSEASMVREMNRRDAKTVAQNLVAVLTGDEDKASNALSFFRSGDNPAYIQKQGYDITAYDKMGNPIKFNSFEFNDLDYIKRLVRSVNTTGLNEDDIVNEATRLMKGKRYNPNTGKEFEKDDKGEYVRDSKGELILTGRDQTLGYGYKPPADTGDGLGAALSSLPADLFKKGQSEVSVELNKALGEYGVKAEPIGTYAVDIVRVHYKDKQGNPMHIDLKSDRWSKDASAKRIATLMNALHPAP